MPPPSLSLPPYQTPRCKLVLLVCGAHVPSLCRLVKQRLRRNAQHLLLPRRSSVQHTYSTFCACSILGDACHWFDILGLPHDHSRSANSSPCSSYYAFGLHNRRYLPVRILLGHPSSIHCVSSYEGAPGARRSRHYPRVPSCLPTSSLRLLSPPLTRRPLQQQQLRYFRRDTTLLPRCLFAGDGGGSAFLGAARQLR